MSLDFTNSTGRGPEGPTTERIVDYRALLRWSREAGSLPSSWARSLEESGEARPHAARAVHRRALELREAVFEVFHADLHDRVPPQPALDTINGELSNAMAHARLERGSEDYGWSWPETDELDAPLWPIARAAAELLVSPDRALVKECACDDCLWIFLDRSRNHGRRWCDMKNCGNVSKVRRHRERKKAQKGA